MSGFLFRLIGKERLTRWADSLDSRPPCPYRAPALHEPCVYRAGHRGKCGTITWHVNKRTGKRFFRLRHWYGINFD